MLEINHGHIVTVASSLGLFSTAGVEVCQIQDVSFVESVYLVTNRPKSSGNPLPKGSGSLGECVLGAVWRALR